MEVTKLNQIMVRLTICLLINWTEPKQIFFIQWIKPRLLKENNKLKLKGRIVYFFKTTYLNQNNLLWSFFIKKNSLFKIVYFMQNFLFLKNNLFYAKQLILKISLFKTAYFCKIAYFKKQLIQKSLFYE